MQNRIVNLLILVVFTIGILGAGSLVWEEISLSNVCPKLIGIPACYIILVCFLVPFFVHIFKKGNSWYFIFTGVAFTIAFVASLMQFTGNGSCPKTQNGIPMCYYSLLLFFSLILLKIISIKNVSKNL